MLQILHRLSESFVARCLFGVLLIGFVIFGIGDVLRMHSTDTDVATVGDATISADQLDKDFRQRLSNFSQKIGGKLDPAQAKRIGFLDHVLNALIDETLVKQAIHDYGFRIGDRQVLQQIQMIPAFQDDTTHQFDPEKFRRVLGANQMSEATFVPYLREQTAIKLFNDTEMGKIAAPQLLVDAVYDYQHQQRRGETLHISQASVPIAAPTDDQLSAYYHAHAEEFTAPQYRTFSYILLSLPDIAKTVTVSDDQLKQAYEAKAAEFNVPERRSLKQFLTQNEATAQQVADLTKKGKTLADAAKEVNESNHYFDLGLTAKDTLPETLQEPVFSATQGTILPPIKTSFGWHIVQIEKIQPARHLPLEEVKNALEAELKTEPAEDKLVETEKKIDDQLAGGAKLAEAGTPFDIKPVTIGPVDATGKRPDGSDDPALKGKTEILQAAFAADEGSAAQMQETKSGDAFAVEVNQVKQPALKDYNLVKDQVEKNVREQEKSNAVSDEAEKLIAEVKKGTSFGTLAKSINVIPVPIGPLARDTKDQAVSPAVNKSLFTLSHVGDVSAVADGDGETLVQLLEIAPPVKSGNDIALVSGSVGSDLQKDITAQYMLALRQKYPVKIHDQVLQQMKAD